MEVLVVFLIMIAWVLRFLLQYGIQLFDIVMPTDARIKKFKM